MTNSKQLQMAMIKSAVIYRGLRFTHDLFKLKGFQNAMKAKGFSLADLKPGGVGESFLKDTQKELRHRGGFALRKTKENWITTNQLRKRELIAHEAFHHVPLVGRSETLAYLVGGFRGVKTPNLKDKLRNAIKAYSRYVESAEDYAENLKRPYFSTAPLLVKFKKRFLPPNWDA